MAIRRARFTLRAVTLVELAATALRMALDSVDTDAEAIEMYLPMARRIDATEVEETMMRTTRERTLVIAETVVDVAPRTATLARR
jgi:hypothetical protein